MRTRDRCHPLPLRKARDSRAILHYQLPFRATCERRYRRSADARSGGEAVAQTALWHARASRDERACSLRPARDRARRVRPAATPQRRRLGALIAFPLAQANHPAGPPIYAYQRSLVLQSMLTGMFFQPPCHLGRLDLPPDLLKVLCATDSLAVDRVLQSLQQSFEAFDALLERPDSLLVTRLLPGRLRFGRRSSTLLHHPVEQARQARGTTGWTTPRHRCPRPSRVRG